jgi:ABC-type antimicrobial peptide transport system permease subunit
LAEQVSSNLAQQRLIARLTTIFGLLALGLACLGMYGVMSYNVARRTGELGIRLALGSTRTSVLWVVLRESLIVIGAGILVGACLSLAGTRLVSGMLFGMSSHDPLTLAGAAVLLLAVSAVSGLVPAWRAAHVDPTEALRAE